MLRVLCQVGEVTAFCFTMLLQLILDYVLFCADALNVCLTDSVPLKREAGNVTASTGGVLRYPPSFLVDEYISGKCPVLMRAGSRWCLSRKPRRWWSAPKIERELAHGKGVGGCIEAVFTTQMSTPMPFPRTYHLYGLSKRWTTSRSWARS